jgi:hypothetical protein
MLWPGDGRNLDKEHAGMAIEMQAKKRVAQDEGKARKEK